MLSLSQLNHFYGESHTLWDINLNVAAGECTCVMGRNGVGKTTLMKCIMGLESVHSGEIHYTDRDLTGTTTEARARVGIGYVPQGREIFPLLTVEENLRLPLAARGQMHSPIPALVFELFPVLKTMLGRRGGDLSGGQQQQLAIGRALMLEPKLLIFDEPTEGIQPNIVHQIGDVIRRLNQEHHLTVLLVEQKLPFARRVADHFVIMEKGRNVAKGRIEDLSDKLVQRHLTV